MKKKPAGFTLIELLLVVSLLAISVGITGDIIISIMRSYNKTQVTNELEQNANFVSQKLEKELRNAVGAISATATSIQFNNSQNNTVCYRVTTSGAVTALQRSFSVAASCTNYTTITNNDTVNGVQVTCTKNGALAPCFSVVSGPEPYVVDINLTFSQAGSQSASFTGSVSINNTIVVRGSY